MWKLLPLILKGKSVAGALPLATPSSEPTSLAIYAPRSAPVSGGCCQLQPYTLGNQSGPLGSVAPEQLWSGSISQPVAGGVLWASAGMQAPE